MVSFFSALLCLSSLGLVTGGVSATTFAGVFFVSMTSSWVFYRLAFPAAKAYGVLLRSAVDLYRNDLLRQWWPELLDLDDDRVRHEALRDFVLTGKRPDQSDSVTKLGVGGRWRSDVIAGLKAMLRRSTQSSEREDAVEEDHPEMPSFAFRLSAIVLLLAIVLAGLGVWRLNQSVLVLEARSAIGPFATLSDGIRFVRRDRGEVEQGSITSTVQEKEKDLSEMEQRLALRRIAEGEQLTRADIGPETAGPAAGNIVELERTASEVSALDLRPGDRVELSTRERGDLVTDTCRGVERSDVEAEAHVVAVVKHQGSDDASVVLQVDDATARSICLAAPGGVELLRTAS